MANGADDTPPVCLLGTAMRTRTIRSEINLDSCAGEGVEEMDLGGVNAEPQPVPSLH